MPTSHPVVCSRAMMPAMLLEEPTLMERAQPITVEQYHTLYAQGLIAENVELLEGLIVEKMPKSPLHSSTIQRLRRKLQAVISETHDIRQEQPITLGRSEPEPDLALVDFSPDDYASGHPKTAEIVIEVAISSVGIDRRKIAIYAEAGVREYWIILPETRQIEVYTNLTAAGRYAVQRVLADEQTASSEVLPAFQIEPAALFPR